MSRCCESRGFATFDAIIALAILGLAVGALAPVAFGSDVAGADSSARHAAIRAAEQALARARSTAREDFPGVLPYSVTEGNLSVTLSVEQPERHLKLVSAVVSWPSGVAADKQRQVRLSTLIASPREEETCSSFSHGDWRRPRSQTYAVADLVDNPSGVYSITGLDVYDRRLYVTTSHGSLSQPTLFVFDVESGAPRLLGSFDNDVLANTGPAAIVVVPRAGRVYAYLASASSFVRGQLQAMDVTAPELQDWQPPIVTYKVPLTLAPSAGLGNSIAYRDGRIYLGLTSVSGGTEFNVFVVSDPLRPERLGGFDLGSHAANAIVVRGKRAYVAHPSAGIDAIPEQLTVLDVTDAANPARLSGFSFPGGIGGNGKSVAVVGSRAYLGRTASRISGVADTLPELFELTAGMSVGVESDGGADSSLLASSAAALATPESVNGLLVRDRLAFALTSSQLQIWDFGTVAPPLIGDVLPAPLPFTPDATTAGFITLPGRGVAIDCEDDVIYTASTSVAGDGFITVFTPS